MEGRAGLAAFLSKNAIGYEKAIEFNLCFDIFLCRFVFGSEHLFDG